MKIYKQRKKAGGTQNQMVSVLGTCAVLLGVGIFGYSVIAVPLWKLITGNEDDQYSSTADNGSSSVTTTVTQTQTQAETEAVTSESTAAQTTAPVTTTTQATTTANSTTTPAVTQPPVAAKTSGSSYFIGEDAMSDINSLKAALKSAGDYDFAVVPLKVKGGKLLYASQINSASLSGAVSSSVSLSEIVSAIKENGMEPAAEISTIADNIYPTTYKKSAYQFADGVTGEWLDNKPEAGGKPWMSPFSDITKTYLTDIVNEITSQGFSKIICTDTYFPSFRDKDIGYIGDIVKPDTRYKGLTELINSLSSTASSNSADLMLEVSASDVINSTSEVFKPESLGNMYTVIKINMNDFPSLSISDIMTKLKDKSGQMKIVPCIIKSSTSNMSGVTDSLKKLGYDYYMVK